VPLYRLFCQATGLGGTTQRAATAPGAKSDIVITVRFDAETAPDLGWEFRPLQPTVTVHPGEERQIFYRAVNKTSTSTTGSATFNVTPAKAGIYFDKLQCSALASSIWQQAKAPKWAWCFLSIPTS